MRWQTGDRIILGTKDIPLTFSVYAPDSDADRPAYLKHDPNDDSLIFTLEVAGHSIWFAADCSARIEQQLLRRTLPSVQLLKVAHHGSGKTTSEAFLEQLDPDAAVISVGPNRYGHPSEEALERLAEANVTVFRTDLDGAVLAEVDPGRMVIRPYLERDIE